jgi:predicted dehydrogenase
MNTPVARPTFALIGVAGYIARRHLEAIREAGGTLIACHDLTTDKRHLFRACFISWSPWRPMLSRWAC